MALRQAVPDELVEPLALGLVRGLVWAGEVGGADLLPAVGELDPREVRELGPVVGQVDGEYPPDLLLADPREHAGYGPEGAGWAALVYEDPELEPVFGEGDGEQGLPVGRLPDDRVVLGDVGPRIGLPRPEVVLVGPAHDRPYVPEGDLPRPPRLLPGEPDVPPQLMRLGREEPPVAKPPDGRLGREPAQGRAGRVYVVDRLAEGHPGGDGLVDRPDDALRRLRAAPRGRSVGHAPRIRLGEV